MRRYFEALYDYEAVIRDYPASPRYHEAIEHELSIAELFAGGLKRRFLGMRILSAAEDAEEIFIRTQERAPGSALGERASWALANYYYDRAHMTSAVEAYDLFLLNYPRSVHREVALMRLIEANPGDVPGAEVRPNGTDRGGAADQDLPATPPGRGATHGRVEPAGSDRRAAGAEDHPHREVVRAAGREAQRGS